MPRGIYPRKSWMRNGRVLTELQVYRIKVLHKQGWSHRSLAWSFGVSKGTIGKVVRG